MKKSTLIMKASKQKIKYNQSLNNRKTILKQKYIITAAVIHSVSVITRLRILGLNENNYEILIAGVKQRATAHLCIITLKPLLFIICAEDIYSLAIFL